MSFHRAGKILFVALAALALPARSSSLSDAETPLQQALKRYPPTTTNAAALDAERLAARLGIDLVPSNVKDRARPGKGQIAAFEAVKESLPAWLKSELQRPTDDISPPPPDLAAYLRSRAEALAALRAGLLRGEAPIWAEDLDQGERSLGPRWIGILYLEEILVADALEAHRRGHDEVARKDMEASWTLVEPLLKSPMFDARMLAIVMERFQVGALRHLGTAPRVWRERLARMTPVDSILEALRLEVVVSPRSLSKMTFSISGPLAGPRQAITRLYWRKCIDQASRPQLAKLDEIESSGLSCDAPVNGRIPSKEFSWWNRIGRAEFHNLDVFVPHAFRLALDVEMTLKILELREARDAGGGRWPDSLPGLATSAACPKDHWIYEVRADRIMRLTLSRPLDWGPVLGTLLPTTYEEKPPSAQLRVLHQ